jgi:hypothetical protein
MASQGHLARSGKPYGPSAIMSMLGKSYVRSTAP